MTNPRDEKFEEFINAIRENFKRISQGGMPALFGLLACKSEAEAREYIEGHLKEFSPAARKEFIDPFMKEAEDSLDFKEQVHRKLVDLTVDLLPELGSAAAVQEFFASVLKAAQTKYAREHSSEITLAFAKALSENADKVADDEFARGSRIRARLLELDKLKKK